MYRVRVIKSFSAAHNLREYEGDCENLHGHNWRVEAYLAGEELDNIGMLVDFKVLKKRLKDVLDELDHQYINDLDYFKSVNPTSENMCRYIYMKLKETFGGMVERVVVWESDNSAAEYFEQ
ncbi:6-carboxytetrahydropterin synthase QueD [Limisalsivibrio acetivorans]|uniref:6-carboxytetrahydropterin synthase QueD n=1 Tax=Limisalsivibrio acetivorans TaxID=1304888 RepID=UPI0003B4BB15|nr:6-carboxytetrahydropterin synthase QueD [Limisalsivibrio acetivorans]